MVADHFGPRLKELREKAGLTQKEVGEKVGVSTNTVARLERGENTPSWPTVVALAQALGVSCEDFMKEPEPQPTEKAGPGRPKKEAEPEPEKPKRGRGRPKKGEE